MCFFLANDAPVKISWLGVGRVSEADYLLHGFWISLDLTACLVESERRKKTMRQEICFRKFDLYEHRCVNTSH